MDDRYYRRTARPHYSGGFQLFADSLAPPIFPSYPPHWFCSHEDGEFHPTMEDAIGCPQYTAFLRQM